MTAIWLLTNDVITDNDVEIAELLMQSYQWIIPSLYGESEQTYTCHAGTESWSLYTTFKLSF